MNGIVVVPPNMEYNNTNLIISNCKLPKAFMKIPIHSSTIYQNQMTKNLGICQNFVFKLSMVSVWTSLS